MSLSDLIAPQLKPKQSKQSKPSQKELRNKAAAAASRAESALGTGGNHLAKEGAVKMRGKEREVKKAKKPSKVCGSTVARLLMNRSGEKTDSGRETEQAAQHRD